MTPLNRHRRITKSLPKSIVMALAWIGVLVGLPWALSDGWQGVLTLALLGVGFVVPFFSCIRPPEPDDPESGVDLFQPGLVFLAFYFIYLWIPACYLWLARSYDSPWAVLSRADQQPTFNYTLATIVLGMATFGAGYRLTGRAHQGVSQFDTVRSKPELALSGMTRLLALVLIVLGLIANLAVLRQLGPDSVSVLTQLSPSIRSARTELAGPLDAVVAALTWGVLLLYFTFLDNRRARPFILIVGALTFVGQYVVLGGKRSYIAPLVVLPVIWHGYLRKRLTLAKSGFIFLAAFVLMAVLLVGRVIIPLMLLPTATYGAAADEVAANPIGFYFDSPDLAQFDVVLLCVHDAATILERAGGWLSAFWRYNFEPILYVVPHALWPGKPTFEDIGQVVYYEFIGSETGVGFAVGIFGALYVFAGVGGALVGMAILGWASRAGYQHLAPYRGSPTAVFGYSVSLLILFMFLRFGTLGFTVIYVVQRMFIGVAIAAALFFVNRRTRAPRRLRRQIQVPAA